MTLPTREVYLERPRGSSLADVVDIILDKGLVIDAFVRVSLLGLELLTIDARIVVASVDTYLRFADATDRVVLGSAAGRRLPGLIGDLAQDGTRRTTQGVVEGAKESLNDTLGIGERRPVMRDRRGPDGLPDGNGKSPRSGR